jgi:creatinine amidohydrolase
VVEAHGDATITSDVQDWFMPDSLTLDERTWPEVESALTAGRRTVVVAFGATEQHGPHLPLSVDRLIGEHLTRLVAERLDAFAAPTVPFGCSEHHLAFPGTISISEATFAAIVHDVVASFAGAGFERIVLLPSHGGNFAPLAHAVASLPAHEGVRVDAVTDLMVLAKVAAVGEAEYGVPLSEGGLHAGEWETSMMLAVHPDLVHPERGEPGFTGTLEEAMAGVFDGVDTLSATGIIGDPAQASAAHGERYWALAADLVVESLGAEPPTR